MTPKQKFLENILSKIKSYQEAYDNISKMPEDIFNDLHVNGLLKTPAAPASAAQNAESSDYGRNVKAVKEIIEGAGVKGIPKSSIVKAYPYDDGDKTKAVTNALSALNQSKQIIGFKPTGIKIKGKYWRIAS